MYPSYNSTPLLDTLTMLMGVPLNIGSPGLSNCHRSSHSKILGCLHVSIQLIYTSVKCSQYHQDVAKTENNSTVSNKDLKKQRETFAFCSIHVLHKCSKNFELRTDTSDDRFTDYLALILPYSQATQVTSVLLFPLSDDWHSCAKILKISINVDQYENLRSRPPMAARTCQY